MSAQSLYTYYCTIYQKEGSVEANEWFHSLSAENKKLVRSELKKNDLEYLLEE